MSIKQEYTFIKVEQPEAGITVITLNRPEKRNALNRQTIEEIGGVLETLQQDLTAKVVILKGTGPSFSSGWDLNAARDESVDVRNDPSKVMFNELDIQFFGPVAKVLRMLWESPVISIAQIHGYAIESALALALTCDLVFAADDARLFWRPLGGAGMLWHLWPWTIGLRKTKEMLFMGEYITGKEAAEMDMINRSVAPELLDGEVMKRARRIAERPREFLYLDKTAVNTAFEAMGMRVTCNSAGLSHTLSHLTTPSVELANKSAEGTIKDMREALDQRASPLTRGE